MIEDEGFCFGFIDKDLLFLLINIHEERVQFFLIDEHKQNEKDTSADTEFDGSKTFFSENLMLILFDEVSDSGECAFLDTDENEIDDLIDVNVVDVADEFFFFEFIGEQAEKEEEDGLSIGGESDDFQELDVFAPAFDAFDCPLDPTFQFFLESCNIEVNRY